MGFADFLGGALGSHTDQVDDIIKAKPVELNQGLTGQQQAYANSLQTQANGTGPSVAGTMLNQANQQNAANMNAQAAGSRGMNAGLAMRNAANANAQADQNTAAHASVARMQEQQSGQQMLGHQLNTMQGQDLNARMATAQGQMQANGINAGIAQGNTATNNQIMGGVMSGISSGAAAAAMAHGGVVPKQNFPQYLASGGFAAMGTTPGQVNPYAGMGGMGGAIGKMMGSSGGGDDAPSAPTMPTSDDWSQAMQNKSGVQSGQDWSLAVQNMPDAMKSGGQVPGDAKVKGDSYSNDIVPTMLSPGEVVIPRSVSTTPGFIEALQKHVSQMKGDGPQGFARVLAAKRGRE
jgi:hypothetical protein